MALLALLVLTPVGSAFEVHQREGELPSSTSLDAESVMILVVGRSNQIGDAPCATVSLAEQPTPLYLQPRAELNNVGVSASGGPTIARHLIVMSYPMACAQWGVNQLTSQPQDLEPLLP